MQKFSCVSEIQFLTSRGLNKCGWEHHQLIKSVSLEDGLFLLSHCSLLSLLISNKKKMFLVFQEKQEHNGDLQPSKGQKQQLCTTCAKGHTCQSVINRTRQMRALIDSKKPYQAHSVFKHLVDEGHKPSLVTYTTLLTALTNQRMFESIPSLLAQVELAGLRPDSIFFNALINAFVEAKRMGEAINTFWKLKHSGCHPTTSTFNTLIKGYGIAGKPEESQRVFDMMGVEESGRPNLTTYNILVKAWCDQRNLEEAWHIVGKMRAGGVEPDIVTYNTIASAYANNDETWRAEELIVEIQTRVRTSERTWGIIIGGYCREGRLEEALRCVRQMKDAGVIPNVVIFNTLLKGFLDANDMAAANNVSSGQNIPLLFMYMPGESIV